jgi:MFS family permease
MDQANPRLSGEQMLMTRAVQVGRLFVIFMGPSLGGLVPLGLAVAQPALAAHFGGGDEGRVMARTLFSLPSLMIVLGAPLGGYLAERLSYRVVLLTSLFVYGVAGSAGLVIDGFIPLLIARLVLGLVSGAIMAIYVALAAAYYEGRQRATVLGFSVATSSIVAVLALELCGRLVDWGGWRPPFAMYLLGFVTLAVAWPTVRGPFHMGGPSPQVIVSSGLLHADGALRLILQLWPVYLVLVILAIGTFTPSAGAPFLLKADGIASATEQGHILSVGLIPAILTASAYGLLRRWFSNRSLLALCGMLMGVGVGAAGLLHDYAPLLAAFLFHGAGSGFKSPGISSILMDEAPENVRAAAAGLCFSGLFLAQFLAPALLEFLTRLFGIHGSFLVIGGMLLATAISVVSFGVGKERKSLQRPTEHGMAG